MSHTEQLTMLRGRTSVFTVYLLLCLFFVATSPAFMLGEGNRNLGLIFFMFISPFFIRLRGLSLNSLLLFGFICSILLFPWLIHQGKTRWSTVFYSLMFCILFISYDGLLRHGRLKITVFLKLVQYLIILYTATLVIQQMCVLLGLPIFNISNYDPNEPWKLNSLAAEPSHSARMLGVLMVSYVEGSNLISRYGQTTTYTNKDKKNVWLCFFWSMLTMGSATAVIMITIVLLSYFNKLTLRKYPIALILPISAILLLPTDLADRVLNLSKAVLLLDYRAVLAADHSGGMRIAPMLVLSNYVGIFSVNGLFGNGVDSISTFLSNFIWGVEDDATGGGLLALWYEYGFITFIFFVIFTIRTTLALHSLVNFLIWFLLIFLGGVNNQMVWLTIIIMDTLRYFRLNGQNIKNAI